MARLAEYVRRSSPGEEDKNYSIDDQRRDVARWNQAASHVLVKTYSDPGGKSWTLNRPIFQQMMADAKAGLFDIVAVGRWDRFSRNQDQQAVAVYQLQQYGVKVISATQPTPDGPIGTLIRNNYAFAAELELYNIRERTTGGKKARVRSGKLPPLAYPLYGYLFADPDEPHGKSRYLPDPETAPVVRYLFELVLSGMKLRAIVRQFEREGIPTPSQILHRRGQLPRGKPVSPLWRTSSIHRILTNPAYIGQLQGWRTKAENIERVHPVTGESLLRKHLVERPLDDPDRVQYSADVCPPLVEADTFRSVQEILRRNKEESARNLRVREALLLRNGFAVCGYCSRHLVAQFSRAGNHYRYHCASSHDYCPCGGGKFSWQAAYLDDVTWRWVLHQFDNPDVIRRKYAQWKAERDEGQSIEHDHLKAIADAIQTAERRKHNFMASAGDATDDEMRAEWTLKATEEVRRIRDLTRDHEELQAVLSRQDEEHAALEGILALGTGAREHLRAADFDDKRRTLYAFKVRVRCWSKDHTPDPFTIGWGFDALHDQWARRHLREAPEGAGGAEPQEGAVSVQSHLWQLPA